MEVILQTTDVTQISYVKMLLLSEGIQLYIFDESISLLEGSLNIFPIRLMVSGRDFQEAKGILVEHGILTS